MPNTPHSSIARLNLSRCGSNGASIAILPIGEPIAERPKPSPSRRFLNSLICTSSSARHVGLVDRPELDVAHAAGLQNRNLLARIGRDLVGEGTQARTWSALVGVEEPVVYRPLRALPLLLEDQLLVLGGEHNRRDERSENQHCAKQAHPPASLFRDRGDRERQEHERGKRHHPEAMLAARCAATTMAASPSRRPGRNTTPAGIAPLVSHPPSAATVAMPSIAKARMTATSICFALCV